MIELRNTSWSIGDTPIVRDISMSVRRGEIFGLVGPNGSGKSTLLRLVTGYLRAKSGSVLIDDHEIADLPRTHLARQIAFVAQHAETAERVTARDAVELGRTPWLSLLSPFSDEDERIVQACLATVDMTAKADQIWSSLSGGERQRIHLARALAQEPQILLLDEPTNHLDIHHQLSILQLVRSQDLTSVIALHDLNQAMECDRIGVLDGGRLVACGPPDETLTGDLLARVFNVRSRFLYDQADGRHLIRFSL